MKKFLRQQATFKKRIKLKWRKPKGRHSKLREKRRGLHKMPGLGYKKKESVRKKPLIIHNLKELESVSKGAKITLSGTIGARKKVALLDACLKKGIIVSNHKNIQDKVKSLKEKKKVKKVKVKPKPKVEAPKKKVVVKKKSTGSKKIVVKGDKK